MGFCKWPKWRWDSCIGWWREQKSPPGCKSVFPPAPPAPLQSPSLLLPALLCLLSGLRSCALNGSVTWSQFKSAFGVVQSAYASKYVWTHSCMGGDLEGLGGDMKEEAYKRGCSRMAYTRNVTEITETYGPALGTSRATCSCAFCLNGTAMTETDYTRA